jgi:hypothetical protein
MQPSDSDALSDFVTQNPALCGGIGLKNKGIGEFRKPSTSPSRRKSNLAPE